MAEPVRRCAGCGIKTGKRQLIRVVRLAGNGVRFDPEIKLEGRSLYFHPRVECFETLMRRGAPEKLMKSTIPAEVRDEIIKHLSRAESEL